MATGVNGATPDPRDLYDAIWGRIKLEREINESNKCNPPWQQGLALYHLAAGELSLFSRRGVGEETRELFRVAAYHFERSGDRAKSRQCANLQHTIKANKARPSNNCLLEALYDIVPDSQYRLVASTRLIRGRVATASPAQ